MVFWVLRDGTTVHFMIISIQQQQLFIDCILLQFKRTLNVFVGSRCRCLVALGWKPLTGLTSGLATDCMYIPVPIQISLPLTVIFSNNHVGWLCHPSSRPLQETKAKRPRTVDPLAARLLFATLYITQASIYTTSVYTNEWLGNDCCAYVSTQEGCAV